MCDRVQLMSVTREVTKTGVFGKTRVIEPERDIHPPYQEFTNVTRLPDGTACSDLVIVTTDGRLFVQKVTNAVPGELSIQDRVTGRNGNNQNVIFRRYRNR